MSDNDLMKSDLSRRDFLSTAAAVTGGLVIAFWMPARASAQTTTPEGAAWSNESAADEVNAWVVVSPDDIVTVRIAQTELGQGVWTSNAMIVAEELQCDWSKVKPQYASANRDAREMAPKWTLNVMGKGATDPNGGGEPEFGTRERTGVTGIPDSLYRRMRTNAAASVKDGRYYLQLAGAEARERLLLAAAKTWGVPVEEVSSKNSVITHRPTGRTTTYGKVAALAGQTPHPNPEGIRIKPPSEWTLMGTEQKNLDVPFKVSGKTVYGIDVKLPGMKWAAVKSCPVYGGKVKSYDFERVRNLPGIIKAIEFPIPHQPDHDRDDLAMAEMRLGQLGARGRGVHISGKCFLSVGSIRPDRISGFDVLITHAPIWQGRAGKKRVEAIEQSVRARRKAENGRRRQA